MNKAKSLFDLVVSRTEYFLACIIAFIFALYCSGRVGYFILISLVLVPAASVAAAFVISRLIRIEISDVAPVYQKGSRVLVHFKVKTPRFIPIPMLSLGFVSTQGLMPVDNEVIDIACSLLGNKEAVIEYEAIVSGGAYVGLANAFLGDYLGITSFKVKNIDNRAQKTGILVTPAEAADVAIKLNEIIEKTSEFKEYDESVIDKADGFGGFPGYDHREYYPGDPVKRINYKLSAKRDELYVRLDEKQVYGRVIITIDPTIPAGKSKEAASHYWQREMEEAVAVSLSLLSMQFAVTLKFPKGIKALDSINDIDRVHEKAPEWEEYDFCSDAQLAEVCEKLAETTYYIPSEDKEE